MYREFPGAAGRPTPAPPSSNEQGGGGHAHLSPLPESANERSSLIVFPSVPDAPGAQRSVAAEPGARCNTVRGSGEVQGHPLQGGRGQRVR